jgi:ribosomal protein S6
MDTLLKAVTELLEKYLGAVLKALWRSVRRILIGIKKLAFPVKDLRTGIKQSRMRYYLVQFSFPNGHSPIAYQEVDSNGQLKRYVDREGKRLIPEEKHHCSVIADGKFQFPEWRKMD